MDKKLLIDLHSEKCSRKKKYTDVIFYFFQFFVHFCLVNNLQFGVN